MGLRVADLGCLEGGFSLALAQRGMNMLGIEARRKNLEKAQLLKEHFETTNLEFLCDDVKNFSRERFGMFDIVLALGILYHLDQPVAWLRQIAEATSGVLVVESHFAPSDESSLSQIDPRLSQLGPIEKVEIGRETYEGRWFFRVRRESGPRSPTLGFLFQSKFLLADQRIAPSGLNAFRI